MTMPNWSVFLKIAVVEAIGIGIRFDGVLSRCEPVF